MLTDNTSDITAGINRNSYIQQCILTDQLITITVAMWTGAVNQVKDQDLQQGLGLLLDKVDNTKQEYKQAVLDYIYCHD